jgi:hypothetical protein
MENKKWKKLIGKNKKLYIQPLSEEFPLQLDLSKLQPVKRNNKSKTITIKTNFNEDELKQLKYHLDRFGVIRVANELSKVDQEYLDCGGKKKCLDKPRDTEFYEYTIKLFNENFVERISKLKCKNFFVIEYEHDKFVLEYKTPNGIEEIFLIKPNRTTYGKAYVKLLTAEYEWLKYLQETNKTE